MVKAWLKIIEGKYMTVKLLQRVPTLCAVEQQQKEPSVEIHEREGQTNQISLNFKYRNGSYRPKVDGDKLTLEATDRSNDTCDIPDSCWFQKEGDGEHYHLHTVVKPKRYLSTSYEKKKSKRQWIFILSESIDGRARITDKKI